MTDAELWRHLSAEFDRGARLANKMDCVVQSSHMAQLARWCHKTAQRLDRDDSLKPKVVAHVQRNSG